MRLFSLLLLTSLAGCARVVVRPALSGPLVGLENLRLDDPLTHRQLEATVFYPPKKVPQGIGTRMGPWPVEGRLGAPIEPKRHPLVILVHGHQGSRFGHHDLAEALARAGYVVAAVDHAGDSWNDQSAAGTDRAIYGRAYQASALIDALLAEPRLGPFIDPDRIGVMGFSAGGLTALLLVGAIPDFGRTQGYCQRHPGDPDFCGPPIRFTLFPPPPAVDRRVRAAFVMAPLGVFLSEASLEHVSSPVFLTEAEKDSVLLPEENAAVVRRGLKLEGSRVVPNAGHFVFLVPCPGEVRAEMPDLCVDPPGVDRTAVHAVLVTDALAFFEQTLSTASSGPPRSSSR